jgi:Domain of unknown function (DUF4419)
MLRVVLTRFVNSFDIFGENSSNSKEDKKEMIEFWNKMACYYGGGSGPTYLSGWITVFCPWDNEGKWMDSTCAPGTSPPPPPPPPSSSPMMPIPMRNFSNPVSLRKGGISLILDGQMFPIIESKKVPSGFVEVDVIVNEAGTIYDTMMVAGQLGGKVLLDEDNEERLGVATGWIIFEKEKKNE